MYIAVPIIYNKFQTKKEEPEGSSKDTTNLLLE